MIRPALAALLTTWLVAQLGADGRSERCWVMRGVEMRPHKYTDERFWLNTDGVLLGWMQRVEVPRDTPEDLDKAARSVGIDSAGRCKGA